MIHFYGKIVKFYTYRSGRLTDVQITIDDLSDVDKKKLEKQDEQEVTDKVEPKPYGQREECLPCQFNYAGECKGFCSIKRNEKSTTDKVEPKFKVCDWFAENKPNNYARFIQILDIVDNEHYKISRDIHDDEDILEARFIKEYYHPFSIEDAKDGDVLVTDFEEDNSIVLYKSRCTIDTINVHCCLDNKFICNNIGLFNSEDVKPATKKQRDLLFQKIKEAGCEWDAEKKYIEKIEL